MDKALRNRFTVGLLGLAALVLLVAGRADAVGNCSVYFTYPLHGTVDAANLNGNLVQAATTNSTPQCLDDYSLNATQMQTTTDPYPAGVESLATSLAGELERLRYVIKTRCAQTQWYTYGETCAMATALSSAQGTITSGTPLFSGTVTWNNAGVTFTALKLNVTDTASASASLLLDLQVAGASKFNVDKNGSVRAASVGPHAFGGAADTTMQFKITGAFSPPINQKGFVLAWDGTLTAAAGKSASAWYLGGTIQENSVSNHASLVGAEIIPTFQEGVATATENVGLRLAVGLNNTVTTSVGLRVEGSAGTGTATNKYAIQVQNDPLRLESTFLDLRATGAAPAATGPAIYNAGGTALTFVGGSAQTDWNNNANNATWMRLTDAGILLFGTTNVVNAAAGEIVLANAKAYRSGNAAASDTFRLIEGDSSNRTLINGGGLNGVVVNAPGPSVWGGTTPISSDRFLVTGAFSTGGGGSGFRVSQTITKTDNTATYGAVFDVGMSTPASGAMGVYAQVFAQGPSVTKNGTATLPATAAVYIPFASLDGVENYGLWSKAPMLIGFNTLTVTGAALGMNKMTATAAAPGANGAKFEVVCGTNAGTAKLIMYAGTSGTAVTVLDNVGAGVSGC